MKTKILLFSLALIAVCSLQAQEKNNYVHLGLTIAPSRGAGVVASGNFDVADNVSIGPLVLLRVGYRNDIFYQNFRTFIGVGVKGDYSVDELLNIPREFDVYAGGQAGWVFTPGSNSFYGAGYPFVSVEVGGRWHWKENMSLFAEVTGGWSASGARGGIAFKL